MSPVSKQYTSIYFAERDHLDVHLAETIHRILAKAGSRKLLDIGCGTGKLIGYLRQKGYDCYGIDPMTEAIRMARQHNPPRKIIKATGTRLPFAANSFDAVISISVIEHIPPKKTRTFLGEMHRVVKKGGTVFLVTPNYASPFRYIQKEKWFGYSDPTHVQFFTPRSLSRILHEDGFRDTRFMFDVPLHPPYEWELPGLLQKLPLSIKSVLTYLLISTPFCFIRNSFWISAKKT